MFMPMLIFVCLAHACAMPMLMLMLMLVLMSSMLMFMFYAHVYALFMPMTMHFTTIIKILIRTDTTQLNLARCVIALLPVRHNTDLIFVTLSFVCLF
jgi:hypothetical protein